MPQHDPETSRVLLFGVPVDLLSRSETVKRAEAAMRHRILTRHLALNVAKLVRLQKDRDLQQDVVGSDIVGIDGMGIVWALRLFGIRPVERVSGVDLMYALLEHCARTGRRPYLLGARQESLEAAAAAAEQRWGEIHFAGLRNGYFGPSDEATIVASIRASGADCLFVAMPTPKKERFLHKHADALGVPFIMGVGGSFDVLSGRVSRAPSWMQQHGLEWLHRLLQEPRKMAWRYISTNIIFLAMLFRAVVRREQVVRPVD